MKKVYVLEHCNYAHFANTVFFTMGGRMTDHLHALKAKPELVAFNSQQEAIAARDEEESHQPSRKIDDNRKPIYEIEVADEVELADNKIAGSDVQRVVRVHHPVQYGYEESPARTENFENTTRFTF